MAASSTQLLAPADATVTDFVVAFEPPLLLAVSVTGNTPAVAKAWVGLCAVELNPSPKSHDHEVGPPVDVSVNWIVWPAEGDEGVNEKFAVVPPVGAVNCHTLPPASPA